MAKRRATKPDKQLRLPPEPAPPPTIEVLPMQLKFGDRFTTKFGERVIVSRPYTSTGGKLVYARVQPAGQPGSVVVWGWGLQERISVKRANAEEGKR